MGVSKDPLALWPNRRIRPGKICKLETLRFGRKPEASKLSATMRWYPREKDIRVEADVVDAAFSIDVETPSQGSSFSLFFAPSGSDETRSRFTISPSGTGDAAVVQAVSRGPIEASWKRTAHGYHITATIPYASINGYRSGWTLMPVDAMVDSNTPDGRCALMAGPPGQPVDKPGNNSRFYAALVRK